MQPIKIDNTVGSVGRPLDFGRDFSLKGVSGKSHIQSRVKSIEKAMEKGKPLPAVELYKIDDEYYVLDGHHRIIAAKGQGQKFIDAHIVEYLPLGDDSRRLLIQKRIEFEDETGLGGINLLRQGDYDKLLFQIRNHKNRFQAVFSQSYHRGHVCLFVRPGKAAQRKEAGAYLQFAGST